MTSWLCVGLQLYGSGGLPCAHALVEASGLLLAGSTMTWGAAQVLVFALT